MRPLILMTCLAATLAACTQSGQYPITGCDSNETYPLTCKQQKAEDPVHEIDASDFAVVTDPIVE